MLGGQAPGDLWDVDIRRFGWFMGNRKMLADIAVHGELVAAARDDAKLINARDPELETERGQALRTLLEPSMVVRSVLE